MMREENTACVCMSLCACVHMLARNLLSEQLAADSAP